MRFTIVYVSIIIVGIPDQASGEVQISMEAEVHYHLLAKRIVELHTRDEMRRVLGRKNEMRKLKWRGFLHVMYFQIYRLFAVYEERTEKYFHRGLSHFFVEIPRYRFLSRSKQRWRPTEGSIER